MQLLHPRRIPMAMLTWRIQQCITPTQTPRSMADLRNKDNTTTLLTRHILGLRKLNLYRSNTSMLPISPLISTYLNINRCTIRTCKIRDDNPYLLQSRPILSSISSGQHWRFPTRQELSKPEKLRLRVVHHQRPNRVAFSRRLTTRRRYFPVIGLAGPHCANLRNRRHRSSRSQSRQGP